MDPFTLAERSWKRGWRLKAASLGLGVGFLGLALATAAAADPAAAWQAAPFNYAVVDQDLRQTLSEFGRNLGLAVEMSDAVRGRVRNMAAAGTAGAFLDALAARYDLVWYLDGAALHIATAGEIGSKILALNGVAASRLQQALSQLGTSDPRLTLHASQEARLVTVSGPPDYVDFVEQTITALAAEHQPEVRVIRGGTAS